VSAESHPNRAELAQFVAGELASTGNRRVVRHLLAGCRQCRRTAAELWRPELVGELAGVVERAFQRTSHREAAIERERREAATLLAELAEQSPTRQLLLILNSRRYCNWFLCEAVIERAFEAGMSDPEAAVAQAEVAVALAERVLKARGDEPVHRDLVGRAWAVLGNARRIRGDMSGADEALARALEELERGSGDPLEESRVENFLGSLRRDQRRFEESFKSLGRAMRCARAAGDDHLVGRALLEQAMNLGETGQPDREIEALREALRLLDGDREPRLQLVAQHNLTWALKECGSLDEALASLQEILPLHARSGKAMDLLQLRWLEGKLAQAQGELGRAETAFREVIDGFLERRLPFDVALASLDLAAVYCEQGQIAEMKRLAAESLPVFHALGIHREALAALALFEQAVERERISLRFIAELAGYLQRARSDPKLTFRPLSRQPVQ
jgi:tetratricopeptide (TPR) repeat protein